MLLFQMICICCERQLMSILKVPSKKYVVRCHIPDASAKKMIQFFTTRTKTIQCKRLIEIPQNVAQFLVI